MPAVPIGRADVSNESRGSRSLDEERPHFSPRVPLGVRAEPPQISARITAQENVTRY